MSLANTNHDWFGFKLPRRITFDTTSKNHSKAKETAKLVQPLDTTAVFSLSTKTIRAK